MAGEEVFGSERGVPESVDPSPYNPIVGEVVELLVRADHRKASFYQVEILQKPLQRERIHFICFVGTIVLLHITILDGHVSQPENHITIFDLTLRRQKAPTTKL